MTCVRYWHLQKHRFVFTGPWQYHNIRLLGNEVFQLFDTSVGTMPCDSFSNNNNRSYGEIVTVIKLTTKTKNTNNRKVLCFHEVVPKLATPSLTIYHLGYEKLLNI